MPGDLVPHPFPHSPFPFDKHIVIHLVDAVRNLLARPVEGRIERLAVTPSEVLLGGPVEGFEGRLVGPPLQVVAELVVGGSQTSSPQSISPRFANPANEPRYRVTRG